MNFYTLNDIRSGNEALMNEVLTASMAALASVGENSVERSGVPAWPAIKTSSGKSNARSQQIASKQWHETAHGSVLLGCEAKAIGVHDFSR